MADPSITFRIVKEEGGVAAAVSSGTASFSNMNSPFFRGMNFAVTLPITDVLDDISSSIGTLADASPLLGAQMMRMNKALQLYLIPIGDTLAGYLKPYVLKWEESAKSFYDEYRDGGLASAIGSALAGIGGFFEDAEGNVSLKGTISNVDELSKTTIDVGLVAAGGITAAAAGTWLLKNFFGNPKGWVATGGSIIIPLALGWATKEYIESNLEEEGAGIVGMIAAAIGFGAIATVGVGIAIPLTFTLVGMPLVAMNMGKALADQFGAGPAGIPGIEQSEIAKSAYSMIAPEQTISAYLNMQTGELELFAETADTIGEEISKNWIYSSDSMAVGVRENLNWIMSGVQGIGDQAVTEEKKVFNLTNSLNALPNIDRTITYKIRYVRE